MSHDPSRDSPTGSSTEGSGTLPQAANQVPVRTGHLPISSIEIEDHSNSKEGPQATPVVSSVSLDRSAAVSEPYFDASTGTQIGPTDGRVPIAPIGSLIPHPDIDSSTIGGRFTVLDELAKGGMGQVSIARDNELDRQVALKEIQPRYAYDRSVAARFLLEARITGKLEHPGIVPVYGLNRYPDGRPYYAMRFITGESLQDALRAFHLAEKPGRDPQERALAMRKLLKRFVDVCNTIAFAHSRGVLHRDLKPANVMLGAFGETLVVDWGLAKDTTAQPKKFGADSTAILPGIAIDRTPMSAPSEIPTQSPSTPMESQVFDATRTGVQLVAPPSVTGKVSTYDSELTEVGKAMGTPAFMAPEQASGRWDDVGMLADIYSLGATLYAILAGKAPFRGESHEILEKVKRGEPTPITEHKPDVPAALAAICRKAMALRPADRYPTALDLANDVERWLADEPIAIFREPWTARAARWARRHRNLVLGSAAVLLTTLIAVTIGYFQVDAERKRTSLANQQTETAYGLLKGEEAKVRESYAKLVVEEKKVRDARNVAERRREEARLALLALTDDAIGEILTSQHAATGKQKQFLESVVGMYRRFIQESTEDDSQLFVAGAYYRVGRLLFKLGDHAGAEQSFRRAIELAREQTASDWRALHGETLLYSGIQQMARGQFAPAEEQFRSARQIFFDLITEDDKAGRESKSEFWYRLGQTEDRLGLVLYNRGSHPEAEAWFRNSLLNRQTLLARHPDDPEYQFRIAQSLRQIAMVCNADGRKLEALEQANAARDICARLLKTDPTSAVYLVQLADIDGLLSQVSDRRTAGSILRDDPIRPLAKRIRGSKPPVVAKLAARTDSARYADNAVQSWSRLVNLYPADAGYRQQLAVANLNLAVAEQLAGRTRSAGDALAATAIVLDDMERRFSADPATTMLRGRLAHAQAIHFREKDELEAAEPAARSAIASAEKLLKDQPGNPRHAIDLAYYQIELAKILILSDQLVDAELALGESWLKTESAAKSPGLAPTDSRIWDNVRGYSRVYADLLAELQRYDQIPVVAKRIDALGTWPDAAHFETAGLFGRAAILATRDARLEFEEQKTTAVGLARNGLARLEKLGNGYEWLNRIQSDPDLLAIRGLEEFAEIVREFREPAPPLREK